MTASSLARLFIPPQSLAQGPLTKKASEYCSRAGSEISQEKQIGPIKLVNLPDKPILRYQGVL